MVKTCPRIGQFTRLSEPWHPAAPGAVGGQPFGPAPEMLDRDQDYQLPEVIDGYFTLSDEPGLGITINEDVPLFMED